MKKYNSFLGAFFSGDNGQGGYNAAYGKSALAKLYTSQDPAEKDMAFQGLTRIDPQTAVKYQQEQDAMRQESLKRKAMLIANAPAAQRGQLYASVLPDIRKDWADAPDVYDANIDAMVTNWAKTVSGATNQNTGVQSTFISGGKLHYLTRDGKPVDTGIEVDDSFQAITDPVTGQISGYGKRGNVLKPTTVGENGNQPLPQAGGEAIGNPVSVQTDNEAPVDFSTLPADEQRALTLASQAAAQGKPFHYTVKGGVVAPAAPQQARIGVKPEAPKATYRPATPQEKAAYGIAADVPARIDSTGKVEPITVPKTGMEKTPAQIEAEQRQKTARVEMSRVLKLMLDEYKTLNETNGITSTERGVLDNIGAYARASDTGQVIGRITGTADQSARDTINQLKPQVLSAVMAASGMSAKQLDSNAEMKLWLSAVTDPQTSYQTVIKVTDNLLKKFTGQGIEQFESGGSKPPAQPPAGGQGKSNYSSLWGD